MPLNRRAKQPSLRTRYITFALLLGMLIISGASIGYRATLIGSHEADEILAQITRQSDHLEHIKELIHISYRSMDLFLLNPEQVEQRHSVARDWEGALFHIEQMRAIAHPEQDAFEVELQLLTEKIDQLQVEAGMLFDIRTDPMRQYPSMDISSRVMQPSRDQISIALSEAIAEAKSGISEYGPENYTDLVELQYAWNRMQLFFRLFMVNRNGGFETEGIAQQTETIRDIYAAILGKLLQLNENNRQGKLEFDGTIAVEVLNKNLPEWIAGFNAIQEIDASGEWRLDMRIMQQNIIPLTDEIASSIHAIAEIIQRQNREVVESHHRIKEMQNLLLGAIIAIFFFYIIAMLISLERMVFRPIAAVAHALKSEAFGESRKSLHQTQTLETQDLIDAFHEMNLQVHKRQMALEYQAMHDALTGLPNRALLLERMEYQLLVARREGQPLSLFILDLNRFKEVNDTLGHHIGDLLLVDVGLRFKACLREIDTIARLGGDEFAILLPATTCQQSETVAAKLVETIQEPFMVDGNQLYIGVSIGIADYPTDGEDIHSLMQHADVAMYNAKLNQIGFTHYNIDEDGHSVGRLSLVQDLRHAIRDNGLELYFQPKIDIFKNMPIGAEALLRWHHPELGFIPPEQVVDIAEGVGLIDALTSWVLNQAIIQCANCHQQGFKLNMSINLSVKNLLNNQLANEIELLLLQHQLDSKFITLEVTESSMMAHPDNSIAVLNQLSQIGVRISVDDFGTGFSSLSYLKQLPVDELKIDKSFVMEMEHNDSDAVIVHSTIELGHNLGLYVVAEGVEDQQTLNILKHYGCDLAQGYFIARPLPAAEFKSWLSSYNG